MGFRQASGTKPSDLATPVPGDPSQNDNALAGAIKAPAAAAPAPMPGAPDATQPSAPPQPSGTPAPADPSSDPFGGALTPAAPAHVDDPFGGALNPAGSGAPVDHMAALANQDVEGSLLGFHVKVAKDGTVTTSLPGQSKYLPPNAAQAAAARAMYSTLQNAGTTGGSMIGEGLGAAAGALAFGAGAVPGAVAGGAAGGAIGSQANQAILDHLKSNPNGAKFLYLLQKMGGISDDDTPMGAGASAILGGVSPILGAVAGSVMKAGGSAIEGATGNAAAKAVADTSAPLLDQASQAAAATGVPLSVADSLSSLPGGGKAAQAVSDASSGVLGPDVKAQYEAAALQKQNALKNYVTTLIQKVAPGTDFSKPSTLGVAQGEDVGFNKNQNLIDKFISNFGSALGGYSQEASEKAGQKQFDIDPIYQKGLGIMREAGGDALASAIESGDYDKANTIFRQQHSSDQDLQGLKDQLYGLRNQISRSSAFAQQEGLSKIPVTQTVDNNPLFMINGQPQRPAVDSSLGSSFVDQSGTAGGSASPIASEMGSTPGQADTRTYMTPNSNDTTANVGVAPNASGLAKGGATYGWINNYVNTLQRLGANDNPLLQQLAGAARSHEGDVLAKIYENDPGRVREIQGANQMYSSSIGQLQDLSKAITSGQSNLGGSVLSWDAPAIRMMKSVMSPDDLAQFRGATLNAGLKDQLFTDPLNGLDPAKIRSTFFSGGKEEAMTELMGEDTMTKLKNVITVADTLNRANVKTGAIEAGVNSVAKQIPILSEKLGTIAEVKKFFGSVFGNNTEALDLLNSKISDYQKFLPNSTTSPGRQDLGQMVQSDAAMAKTLVTKNAQLSPITYQAYKGDNSK